MTAQVILREQAQDNHREYVTQHWQADGCLGEQYRERTNQLRAMAGISRNDARVSNMTTDELRLWCRMQVDYHFMRQQGMTHEQVVANISYSLA